MRKNPLYLKVLVVLLLLLAALLFVVNSRAALPILQGRQTPQFVWLSSWQPVQGCERVGVSRDLAASVSDAGRVNVERFLAPLSVELAK